MEDSSDQAAIRPGKGQVVELLASDLLTNGQAVGRVNGSVVFVAGPLPGERARVRIVESKKSYLVAEMVEMLETSPDRVEPFCGVFGRCGGCQLQHWNYDAQLAWKRDTVVQALKRIGGIGEVEVGATVGMAVPRAYRNKMSLVVGGTPAVPILGFYEARSHDLVPIRDCPIVLPALQEDLHVLNKAIHDPETRPGFGDARHVVVRRARSTGEGVMALTSLRSSHGIAQRAKVLRERFSNMIGLTNSYSPTGDNVVLGREQRVVAGKAEMQESIAGVTYRVSVQSFFQVNGEMVEQILSYMRDELPTNSRILDLYCGAGTFAVAFAKMGNRVVGLEENPLAVEEGRANAKLNGVAERAYFVHARVEDYARGENGQRELAQTEMVFLDPPRKGSDELTLSAIINSGAKSVWYLSCNPATLARDAAILVAGGFTARSVQPFDMFPQTGHIEVLMHLAR